MLSTPLNAPSPSTLADPDRATLAPTLTLETALWLALGVAALGLRLLALARWPLAEGEAALALQAWRFASGQPYELGAGLSPLAFNLQALLFLLFGASDTTARIAQSIAGTALVLAPWLLRPLLGRGRALAMAALLAVSPAVLFFSRHASGDIWAALCALLFLAGAARYLRWGAPRDGVLAALGLGLGLASAPGFWSVLAAGGLFAAWERWRGGRGERGEERGGKREEGGEKTENGEGGAGSGESNEAMPPPAIAPFNLQSPISREHNVSNLQLLTLALVTFILAATGFLTNLAGLGAGLNLPLAWGRGVLGAGPELALPFLFVVLLYEGLGVAAGLVGGSLLAESEPRWARFAFVWLAATLLPATLANSGWAAGLVFVALPLALLGSEAIARLVGAVLGEGRWGVEGLYVGLGVGLLIYGWININSYLAQPAAQKLASLALALGVLAIAAALVWQSYGRAAAGRALGLTLLVWLTIVSGSSAWGLSLARGADPREPLVVRPSDADLRTGAALLADISLVRYRDPAAIPLGIQRTLGAAPRWYFRAFRDQREVEGSHADLPEAALLDADAPPPPERIGNRVWLGPTWQWALSGQPALLRWLTARDEPTGLGARAAVLYVTLSQE